MKDGPGLTCLYKDGEAQNFEASEVEQMMADGWADSPTAKKLKKAKVVKPASDNGE